MTFWRVQDVHDIHLGRCCCSRRTVATARRGSFGEVEVPISVPRSEMRKCHLLYGFSERLRNSAVEWVQACEELPDFKKGNLLFSKLLGIRSRIGWLNHETRAFHSLIRVQKLILDLAERSFFSPLSDPRFMPKKSRFPEQPPIISCNFSSINQRTQTKERNGS